MVVLKPGEFFFGASGEKVKTLLGSCVAISLWHPQRRIGGLCHYLLPSDPRRSRQKPDGRYADQALELFMAQVEQTATLPGEYEVKIFGGGNMFPGLSGSGINIGLKNIEAARALLKAHQFRPAAEHVGREGHRTVILDLATGHTWVRWQDDSESQATGNGGFESNE